MTIITSAPSMAYHSVGDRHEAFLMFCRDHGFGPDEPMAAISFEDEMQQEIEDYDDDLRSLARNGMD